jgi:ribose transport system ATP-binding protein
MKILCGVHKKDEGQIIYQGKALDALTTDLSQKLGISIIYQELSVLLDMNAAENIFINREQTAGRSNGLIQPLKRAEMKQKAREIFNEQLSVNIDLEKPARFLSLAQRQMIEIARSLVSDARIIIMDEPTAALEKSEQEQLFKIIRRLKAQGTAIIYVSHILKEVLDICDDVMILRDGNVVANEPVNNLDVSKVINYMIGKTLKQQYPKESVPIGEIALRVEKLSDRKNFKDVAMTARMGEVIGIAGLEGCGKNEVVRTIFGINKPVSGSIYLNGKKVNIANIKDAVKCGIAFLPADRKTEGLFLEHDIKWNVTIANMKRVMRWYIRRKSEDEATREYIQGLSIKTTGPNQTIMHLSGGNQQKVMISRWLFTEPEIILMEEPTRGIDVNAKTDVYRLIMDCAKNQKTVVLVSSEIPELLGMCDRIYVMHEGSIVAELPAAEATEALIAHYSVNTIGEEKNACNQ